MENAVDTPENPSAATETIPTQETQRADADIQLTCNNPGIAARNPQIKPHQPNPSSKPEDRMISTFRISTPSAAQAETAWAR
jgi:hypothetical protein